MNEASPATPLALVVEDETSVAMLLRFILEREGFTVETAADGQLALSALRTLRPAAVVMLDLMLPYVDGFSLIHDIRAQPGWEEVPIVVLSARGGQTDIARALDAGADDYVVKPFQPDELKARLRRLLRSRM